MLKALLSPDIFPRVLSGGSSGRGWAESVSSPDLGLDSTPVGSALELAFRSESPQEPESVPALGFAFKFEASGRYAGGVLSGDAAPAFAAPATPKTAIKNEAAGHRHLSRRGIRLQALACQAGQVRLRWTGEHWRQDDAPRRFRYWFQIAGIDFDGHALHDRIEREHDPEVVLLSDQ